MRFAVDESTGKKFDAIYIGDIFKSATDEIVLSFAEREKRILITDDRDFGELVFRLKRAAYGVILLRLAGYSAEQKIKLLLKVLKKIKVSGKFVVITGYGLRIRQM